VSGVPILSLNRGLSSAGLLWFGIAFLLELAPRVTSDASVLTTRTLLFLWSIPALALLARSTSTGLQRPASVPWPLVLIAGCVLAVFVLTATAETTPLAQLPRSVAAQVSCLLRGRSGRTALGLVCGAFLVGAGLWTHATHRAHELAKQALRDYVSWFAVQPHSASPVLSEGAGSLVIVEFHDYQCPPCGKAFEEYTPLIRRLQHAYPGRVKYLVKDFPLDSKCNEQVKHTLHPLACEAAVAVRLARQHGINAEALEKWLFSHQRELSDDALWKAAQRLSGIAFSRAAYDAALADVLEDVRLAKSLGVQQTPTFFIDGVRLQGLATPDQFEAVVASEIRRLGFSVAAASDSSSKVVPK
jgi:protein-disulfide isomerase